MSVKPVKLRFFLIQNENGLFLKEELREDVFVKDPHEATLFEEGCLVETNERRIPVYLYLDPICSDPIVERVVEKLRKRSNVGVKKYGTTLAENNTDDFLNHLQEELLDASLYAEKKRDCKR